jgi:hypothetical protein
MTKTPPQGAATIVFAAASLLLAEIDDPRSAERLWQLSEQLLRHDSAGATPQCE